MQTLREEILQAQRTRSDLLKWKLGLVGVIGSVGLGLAGSRLPTHADLVLCAIPFVCVYVDLLCRHLSLRMIVVGAFFRDTDVPGLEAATLSEYEDAVKKRRDSNNNPFVLEDSALTWSTVVLSAALIVFGILTLTHGGHDATPAGITFMLAASVGAIGTIWAWLVYKGRASALDQPPPAD